jgi:hypothetical protein
LRPCAKHRGLIAHNKGSTKVLMFAFKERKNIKRGRILKKKNSKRTYNGKMEG